MMDADDHSESSDVMDLGLSQMDQQVAHSPIQDAMQGRPDLGRAVRVQPARHSDLLPHRHLRHPHRLSPHRDQGHPQLPQATCSRPGTGPPDLCPSWRLRMLNPREAGGNNSVTIQIDPAKGARWITSLWITSLWITSSEVRRFLVRFAGDIGSKPAQRLGKARITAVDVMGSADRRLAIGDQAGDDQCSP